MSMTAPPGLPARVDIREVGLRDGLQIETPLATEEKIELLEALVGTGASHIEATAFVSPRAVPAMADADRVAAFVRGIPGVEWSALVPNLRGAQRAITAGLTSLEYVVSASNSHSLANTNQTTAAATAAIAEIARVAHNAGGRCEVIVAVAWDCPFEGRTPTSRTVEVCERAMASGADQVCLGDTIGTTVPGRVVQLVDAVGDAIGAGVPLGAHFHNTRGVGLASAWAALSAGVTMLDASIGGLGGCPFAPGASGNIATEEVVYLLEESGVETGLDLAAALDAAEFAQRLVAHHVESALLRAGGPSRPRPRVKEPGAEG